MEGLLQDVSDVYLAILTFGGHVMSFRFYAARITILAAAAVLFVAQLSCGGGTVNPGPPPGAARGTASVSISDPPSCKVPNGIYKNVFITITSVQAHISSSASDGSSGWVELAPSLATAPVQIDLLASPTGGCTLSQLGSNVSLPVGDYQQIRLILVANNAASGPSNNACASVQGFNCAVTEVAGVTATRRLELSSQANTGLKIPPGQIVGGPIRVTANQHVDINIDFNACASIVTQGNGQLRLKPTLTAGQVSTASTGISGQVVDASTQNPIAGGTVFVALEQPDSNGVDRIVMQAATDANGNFNFCPLPTGTYDIVAVAVDGSGNAFAASVALGVPAGTAFGKLPLNAVTGPSNTPATIEGVVSAANGANGVGIDAAMSALQSVNITGGTRLVTIPLLNGSVANVATVASPTSAVCAAGTFCEKYLLSIPASNPSVGTFVAGGTTFTVPATGPVSYTVDARAFAPTSGGATICNPNRITTDRDTNDQPLVVTIGGTVTAKTLNFVSCQ